MWEDRYNFIISARLTIMPYLHNAVFTQRSKVEKAYCNSLLKKEPEKKGVVKNMIFQEKRITLKNQKECILKSPDEKDALELLQHLKTTSDETNHMLRYSEEITMTEEEEKKFLQEQSTSENKIMIAAYIDGKLVGNAGIGPVHPFIRTRHRASFGISIQREYWQWGIGSAILKEIIESAKLIGYEQIELSVVAENERGITLYEKFGFQKCGTLGKAHRYKDGTYSDEYTMVLYLL